MSCEPEAGPEDLDHFEDRVLFHIVDLAGATRPLGLGEFLQEEALLRRLRDDPDLDEEKGDPRHILLEAFRTLDVAGLANLMKVMGPWGVRPTRRGRDRVIEWQKSWRRNRDAMVQHAILLALDTHRRACPDTHETDDGVDVERLAKELRIDRAAYVDNAEQLLARGHIGISGREGASLEDGHAYITERGAVVLDGLVGPARPAADTERAWNEVARLRKELEMIKQSPADLIADPELLRRCADLLNADLDFDRVIREASVVLEDRIRRLTGSDARSAVPLMQSVFSANRPVLRISDDMQEQTGAMNLYTGVMGLFRNQGGHRLSTEVTQRNALQFVVMVDLLLSLAGKATQRSPAEASASAKLTAANLNSNY